MRKVFLIFGLLLFLFSACQEKPNITEPTQDKPNPYGFGYGSYQQYLFGECDDNMDFTSPPRTVTLKYKGVLNINGTLCNQFELYDDSTKEVKFGFLAMTDKWIKLFSNVYAPFLYSQVLDEYAPLFWQTIWTRDYTKSSFDTVTQGKCIFLHGNDTIFGFAFADCEYHFKYKFEDIGEGVWCPMLSCGDEQFVKTRGTKISFVTIAKLTDKKKTKFQRIKAFKDWNYDEFYFDDDRSSYIDKVEMKVFVGEKVGITSIWIKHKTIARSRTYVYKLKKNYTIKFG